MAKWRNGGEMAAWLMAASNGEIKRRSKQAAYQWQWLSVMVKAAASVSKPVSVSYRQAPMAWRNRKKMK
jgi:hypothetical protein